MNKRPSSPSSPALSSSNNIGECDVNERDTEKDSNDFKRAKTVPTATTSSSSDPNTPAATATTTTTTTTTTCTSSATASLSTVTVMDDDDDTINDDDEISKVIAQAWSHYRNYIEDCTTEDDDHDGDDDGEGNGDDNNNDNDVAKTADIDELYEIICLFGDSFNARAHAHAHAHANGSNSGETNDKGISIKALEKMSKDKDYNSLSSMISMSSSDAYRQGLVQQQSHTLALLESNSELSLRSLVPALLSMVHLHIANDLISQGVSSSSKPEPEPEPELMNNNSNNNGNDNHDTGTDTETDPMIHLQKSLNYFPWNASSLSILANYKRMNLMDTQQNICTLYEIASVNASRVRELAISVLGEGEEEEEEQVIGGDGDNQEIQEDDDDKVQGNMHKEWVELLFLDGMTGVEYVGDDDDDGGCCEGQTTSGDDNENTIKDQDSNSNQNEKENVVNEAAINSEYSTSDVESVSSFMAALLHSTLRNHEMALFHLKKFNFTHRIHPNVWAYSMGDGGMKTVTKEENQLIATTATASKDTATLAFEPKIFRGNVLPKDLYNGMCNVFAPKKPYWEESNYQNRGYYSFFNDLTDDILSCPSNLIEDVVINHLLPLIKAQIPSHEKIVGFEWWTHTRPLSANLGHQLHFDTDEALLDKEKKVTHPIISSVLYLTGNKDSGSQTAGSTIVFNQTPDSKEVASKAYVSHALNNSFMIFPGNCLHGVLPCPGSNEESNQGRSNNDGEERLTFMVGFWTRRVPDNIEEKKLYSPCGPLPPADDEHSWVKEIKKGYDGETKREDNAEKYGNKVIIPDVLPAISPAWECIAENGKNNSDDDDKGHETENLPIPCSLDHRFFVHNAPQSFRESLFKDETFA